MSALSSVVRGLSAVRRCLVSDEGELTNGSFLLMLVATVAVSIYRFETVDFDQWLAALKASFI